MEVIKMQMAWPVDEHAALKAAAATKRVPMSIYVRQAVAEAVARDAKNTHKSVLGLIPR